MDSRRRAITYNFRHKGLKEPGLGGGGTSVLLLKGWRQEDGKSQDSLGYIARPHLTKVKNKTKEQNEQIPQPRFLVSDLTLTLGTSCLHTQIRLMGIQGTLLENQVPKMTITRTEIPWEKHAKAN